MKIATTLKNLLPTAQPVENSVNNGDISITGLCADSREVQPGDLFFALTDEISYIEQAIQRGAHAILSAHPLQRTFSIPFYYQPDLAQQMGHIASVFYHQPSQNLAVIGITGTSGKTSCSYFIAQALELAGIPTGVIGTLGNGRWDKLHPGKYTTPDALSIQQLLAEFRHQQLRAVSMEVSSHALDQGRVQGTEFFMAGFTNLSHDHLDYHGTFEKYAHTKKRLFTLPNVANGVINADDAWGQQWLHEFHGKLPLYALSTAATPPALPVGLPLIHAFRIHHHAQGMSTSIRSPWGEGILHTALHADFNISNLLMALVALQLFNLPFTDSLHYLSQMKNAPGRMQTVGGIQNQPLVMVDYAHKPEALSKVLQSARQQCRGKLWCVFGCGGNRDRSKRPLMAKIAEQWADEIIVTDDNPRHENPREIVAEIMAGFTQPQTVMIEHDRRAAIAHAISCANQEDIVVIAGKGHENYQIVGDEHLPFNDLITVKLLLLDKG